MNNFRLTSNGIVFNLDVPKVFSGGELHVNINHLPQHMSDYHIKCRLQSSDDIMHLVMLKSALDEKYGYLPSSLFIPYLPYARQDRVCSMGDANALKQFCKLLGSLNFSKITTLDIHSDAAFNTLDIECRNVTNISQIDILQSNAMMDDWLKSEEELVFVSPDKGATLKTKSLGDHYHKPVIQFRKKRNPVDGSLSGFETDYTDDLSGKTCIIFDDICDGGGTFIGIADVLKQLGCRNIHLFVTHGIFSRGLEVFDKKINVVYSTDSFSNDKVIGTEYTDYVRIHV